MDSEGAARWATDRLDSVADGSNTMSQRKLASVVKRGGGIQAVKAIAASKSVHLSLPEDDKGNKIIAAATRAIRAAREFCKSAMEQEAPFVFGF